jgi:malate synthase
MSTHTLPAGVEITGPVSEEYAQILTPQALAFLAGLQRTFGDTREQLLRRREERQREIDAGRLPDFLPETKHVRDGDWSVAPVPADLQKRWVEITGPAERKMTINALNSGADVFMADFEDAFTPTWDNLIQGQINMRDAVRRTITFSSPDGREYRLNEQIATLLVRPRGWHLREKHVLVDGKAMSGSLFDFGLYFFHNAHALLERGTGPYFYLPKMESHLEARLWNDVFNLAQDEVGVPRGTIKATVLIETILAAFEMDEILYELREHSAGLNAGRWDYIFSCIKKFRNHAEFIYPDRGLVTMTTHFLRSYAQLLIKTCHRRNIHAIGGMAAQIPVRDPKANEEALAKVRADKERESGDGHDGTWVAHPGLVQVAREPFARVLGERPHQIDRKREDVHVTAQDLLDVPEGPITEVGLRLNVSVGVQYLGSWLPGTGCVAINNLMEDAATAEISRSQVWQWIWNPAGVLDDGRKVTVDLFRTVLQEEVQKIHERFGEEVWSVMKYQDAADLFDRLSTSNDFVEFLTLPAYELID